jgi:two-component system alkaline phosphatase synthesis response regulator PhoP
MLTARGQEIDKVVGLELGADDYVTKPFSIRELMARVKAVLRRTSLQTVVPPVYRFGDVEVNVRGNEVRRAGRAVELSTKEFALLAYFIAHPAETLTRDRLLDAVWGYENYPNTRTVDTHIVHLRQKLEPNPEEPRFFVTVHGSGYKFVE